MSDLVIKANVELKAWEFPVFMTFMRVMNQDMQPEEIAEIKDMFSYLADQLIDSTIVRIEQELYIASIIEEMQKKNILNRQEKKNHHPNYGGDMVFREDKEGRPYVEVDEEDHEIHFKGDDDVMHDITQHVLSYELGKGEEEEEKHRTTEHGLKYEIKGK